MIRYAGRRVLVAIPVVVLVTMLTFVLLSRLPGDAAASRLGVERGFDEAAYQEFVEKLNLNQPLPLRYFTWLTSALRGDLGLSMRTDQPVWETIVNRFPVTLELGLLALGLAIIIGFTLGILSARKSDSIFDNTATFVIFASISIPVFWLGLLMIYLFSVHLHWLPPSGFVPIEDGFWPHFSRMIMPVIAVSLAPAALIARQVRGAVLGVTRSDYIVAARAKGLSRKVILRDYILRNAMVPVLTVLGLEVASLLAGAVLAESVFSLPGIGLLLLDSIFFRDFTMVQGVVVLIAVMMILVNLTTDLLYAVVDPRVRYE
jgi:peptide/nickel transport system permease protein